jgi:chromosome segregation ATPase
MCVCSLCVCPLPADIAEAQTSCGGAKKWQMPKSSYEELTHSCAQIHHTSQAASQQRSAGGGGGGGGAAGLPLDELMQQSQEDLAKELQAANAKIADLEAYTTELDSVTDSLQRQLEESKADPDARLEEKEKVIDALQAEIERMEREMGGQDSGDMDAAINYDALDKLDEVEYVTHIHARAYKHTHTHTPPRWSM